MSNVHPSSVGKRYHGADPWHGHQQLADLVVTSGGKHHLVALVVRS
jgi:hypothetical protein